jgi:hypothetical protein
MKTKINYSQISVFVLISLVTFSIWLPLDVAIASFVFFWAFIAVTVSYFSRQRRKYFFGMSFDDIHVVGLMEGDQIPDIRREYQKHCVFVDRKKVRKTAEKIEARLRANQNKNFEAGKMIVHRHYYQSGDRINETPEEYSQYLNERIWEARLRVHSDRAKKGGVYIAVKEEDRKSFFHSN